MFILYAVILGVVLGLVAGGRPAGLSELHFRWPWLILAGLLVQVALFSGPISERVGDLGPVIYVASTAAVVVAVLANARIPGMAIVALGAACNLAAIVANGGYMPAGAGAMAALGKVAPSVYSNSSVVVRPMLEPLTDIFAMPAGAPFANVFSLGDVIIGVGVVVTIVAAMRRASSSAPSVPAGNSPEQRAR